MEKLDKILKRFSLKECEIITRLIEKILFHNLDGLNVKKLKGLRNLFRVRKVNIRVIFELKDGKEPNIVAIERKNEATYKF